jgi:DNA-binding transcriptional regulator YdaS (Cro superfamily)
MKKTHVNMPLAKAVDIIGSQAKLALLLGVKPPTVNQWLTGVKPIPIKRCPQIEKLVGGAVRCEDLLPTFDWSYMRVPNTKQ